MKIVSVKDKRIKALVENPGATKVRGLTPVETRKIIEMIGAIKVMQHPLELRAIPAWRAHELIPGHPNKWSLMVTGNYRLTFRVEIEKQEVHFLDYEDYH